MIVRHKLFSGIPAYYTDSETGDPLFNQRGELANEDDVHRSIGQVGPDLDRLTLEMCRDEREHGNSIPMWLNQAESDALERMKDVAVIDLCRSIRTAGGRMPGSYRDRFAQALLRRGWVDQGSEVERGSNASLPA